MKKSSLQYIRETYNVTAHRGGRIRYTGGREPKEGTVTRGSGPHIMVRFDGSLSSVPMHPTWEITYL